MSHKFGAIACGVLLALALAAVAPAARATDLDQASQLTFSQPVQLPGNMVLPAGTYWFVLAEPLAAPGVVQVFNMDRSNIIATLMTAPTIRNERTDHSVFTLAEQSKKQPDALLAWYYPDRMTGHEFLYSSRMENKLNEDNQIVVVGTPAKHIVG